MEGMTSVARRLARRPLQYLGKIMLGVSKSKAELNVTDMTEIK